MASWTARGSAIDFPTTHGVPAPGGEDVPRDDEREEVEALDDRAEVARPRPDEEVRDAADGGVVEEGHGPRDVVGGDTDVRVGDEEEVSPGDAGRRDEPLDLRVADPAFRHAADDEDERGLGEASPHAGDDVDGGVLRVGDGEDDLVVDAAQAGEGGEVLLEAVVEAAERLKDGEPEPGRLRGSGRRERNGGPLPRAACERA